MEAQKLSQQLTRRQSIAQRTDSMSEGLCRAKSIERQSGSQVSIGGKMPRKSNVFKLRATASTLHDPDPRATAAQRGYGYRWQRARKIFLRSHPLCAECLRKFDCPTPATVVDHIRPHRGDPNLFWDKDNWQALCKQCHDRKTAEQDGAFGRQVTHKKSQPT
jgi:5-methylcytosine-specific restriction protein A